MQLKSQNRIILWRMREKKWNKLIYQLSGIVECLIFEMFFLFLFGPFIPFHSNNGNVDELTQINILAIPNQSFLWVSWTYRVICVSTQLHTLVSLFLSDFPSSFLFFFIHFSSSSSLTMIAVWMSFVFFFFFIFFCVINEWFELVACWRTDNTYTYWSTHFNALKFLQRHRASVWVCVRTSNCKRKRKDRTLYLNGTEAELKRMRGKKSLKKKQLNEKNMNSKWEKNVIGWPWPMDWEMMMVMKMMTAIDFGLRFFENHTDIRAAFHMALMWMVSACAHI